MHAINRQEADLLADAHQVTCHGVLAPAAAWRAAIVPGTDLAAATG